MYFVVWQSLKVLLKMWRHVSPQDLLGVRIQIWQINVNLDINHHDTVVELREHLRCKEPKRRENAIGNVSNYCGARISTFFVSYRIDG